MGSSFFETVEVKLTDEAGIVCRLEADVFSQILSGRQNLSLKKHPVDHHHFPPRCPIWHYLWVVYQTPEFVREKDVLAGLLHF